MAIVGKPSPAIPFTSPAKRKIPETMSSVESAIAQLRQTDYQRRRFVHQVAAA
jgi:hypothetical protein